MEEAEALSTRLGIMVSGNFKCIGTPQHIKSKYGKGFEIEVKTKTIKRDELERYRAEKKIPDGLKFSEEQMPGLMNQLGASQKTR